MEALSLRVKGFSILQHKNASMSLEEKNAQSQRAKATAAKQLCRKRKNASMSPEERQANRAKETAYRQSKNASMSPEERQAILILQMQAIPICIQAARSLPRRRAPILYYYVLIVYRFSWPCMRSNYLLSQYSISVFLCLRAVRPCVRCVREYFMGGCVGRRRCRTICPFHIAIA